MTDLGLEGDLHREPQHHGGPERALCIYAMEQIRVLQSEGHSVFPGAIGENLTVEGLDWEHITPGSRVSQKRNPGGSRVYARVLREGTIRQGDTVTLVDSPPE